MGPFLLYATLLNVGGISLAFLKRKEKLGLQNSTIDRTVYETARLRVVIGDFVSIKDSAPIFQKVLESAFTDERRPQF